MGLQTQVVNDKGRYRQQPESTALETFKRSHLRPRSRVDHSLHPEVFVCSRCSAQLFGQKRGQAETESVPVRLLNRGTGGRKCVAYAACGISDVMPNPR